MSMPMADLEAEIVLRRMLERLRPSVGQQFLIEVTNKEGPESAVSLIADLMEKCQHRPLTMQDLSPPHQMLLSRAEKVINRRGFFREMLTVGVIGVTLADGIKHLPEMGEPSEYTAANMYNRTEDGRDIVRGPAETATGLYMLSKYLKSTADCTPEAQIMAVASAISQLGEHVVVQRDGASRR